MMFAGAGGYTACLSKIRFLVKKWCDSLKKHTTPTLENFISNKWSQTLITAFRRQLHMAEMSSNSIRILHVDDDPDFADMAATLLETEDERFTVETATSAAEGLERLTSDIDCIVSDYDMPGQSGIEFLKQIRAKYPEVPFILFTGKGSEEVASDAISAGVTEYLQKESGTDQYTVLANRIANAVKQFRAQEALEASQERLSLFIEQSPLGVIEWNDTFEAVQVNDAAEDILGYTEAGLNGRSWEAIIPESDRDTVSEVVTDLLDAEGGYHSVNENVRKDGTRITCEWHNRVITDGTGDAVAIFSQFQDITERKQSERELEETNAVLSMLFETLPVGVLAEDAARDVIAVNQRVFELFEISGTADEAIGTDCERMAEEVSEMFVDADGFVERINEMVAERKPTKNEELALADGRTFERSYRPIELPDGDGHLWMYGDITDRKAHEVRLKALNETTHRLMSADSRERICEIGVEAACNILGLDANAIHLYDDEQAALVPVAKTDAGVELVGDIPTFTEGDSIAWRAYEQRETLALDDVHDDPDIYNPDTPVRSELYLPLGDHGLLIAGSETSKAFDQQDIVFGEILADAIVVALDQVAQTERLRDRERELTRQNDQLEEFTSVVSHDLRNPLSVAVGRLELVREECESEHLDTIARAHERMETLIENLLTLARHGETARDITPVDLTTLSENCWQNVVTTKATLAVDIDRRIQADRSSLQQLLENLMRNAVEHGGEDVTVTVGELEDGFYVEDDGPGIPENARDEVFEAGYSTAEDGNGFGLSIVKQVADGHGWTICVTDGSEGGARFEVRGAGIFAE